MQSWGCIQPLVLRVRSLSSVAGWEVEGVLGLPRAGGCFLHWEEAEEGLYFSLGKGGDGGAPREPPRLAAQLGAGAKSQSALLGLSRMELKGDDK